jgi:DNA-binding SARP family transcriptional activator
VLHFRILGQLEVRDDEAALPLAGQRQRALLALLLVRANEVVPTETLVDLLWGERPPRTATTSLQNAVSQLRKLLGPSVLLTKPPGYLLDVDSSQTDVGDFERLLAAARDAGAEERARLLREALALFRGPPLAEFALENWAQPEIHRLEEVRLNALEDRIEADLELNRHAEVVGELEGLVAEHPLRERLRGQLMLALYRSGRQAEALQLYHTGRRALVDELGIEPSRRLQELYGQILRQEHALQPAVDEGRADDELGDVVAALLGGRLVPVLGAGANPGAQAPSGRPLPDDLAAALADAFGCPPEYAGALTRVAQWIAVTRGVGPLYDELHALLGHDAEPGPVHRLLAGLPPLLRERGIPQQLVVTTNYDRALEHAYADAGEPVDVVTYISLGRDHGKFLHRTAEGDSHVIHLPNAYADVPLESRPVILKIHGDVDVEPAATGDSFVVSEDDYIGYLVETGIGGVLPVTLAARLRRSHFLFLGYGVLDWSLRVFLHRLWPDEQVSYRSWALAAAPVGIERQFWRRHNVDLLPAPLEQALEPLRERLLAANAAGAAA